ncbi:polysaccharide deacetylase family protein [Solwaraspora sp. WMMD792]|uniref:polysaccharide deacetylase family protein n=1 Tax=Solwaraspora sp. WMMD792 TaxID=3016099 RepID=UPI0024173FF3|nr:polysaccharide deacetylase family protein [Solwaraspora sp. WMMD792]MDG4774267.1 polysaccharide deacetylase family protein [Solwaraspora sp. WMMD792]
MPYAGVSWSGDGYRLAVLDDTGEPVAAPAWFNAADVDAMIDRLHTIGAPAVVVDSTNGILDGRMMAAGLVVYRADPHLLPPRPDFGSVPADVLARAAWRDLGSLVRLDPTRGTQTGREHVLRRDEQASAAALAAMVDKHRCVTHGDRGRPTLALTFDDGPAPGYTAQILDVLRRFQVPAVFFCVGMNAAAHPDLLHRMIDEGHTVGNHTWSHPFLPELARHQLLEQLERTNETIEKATGAAPRLFRPPYGSRTPEVLEWLRPVDSTMVLWDVEPVDWAMPGTEIIAERVLDTTRNGSIVLLHDGGGDRSQVVAALPRIIEGLLERSFRFVAADEFVTGGR